MGRLLIFPSRLNPLRRWISLHHGRKGYMGLPKQIDHVYWSKEDFRIDDYDDKHVINCDDNYGSDINDKNDYDTSITYDNKRDLIINDHGYYDYSNELDHQNHNDHDMFNNYEKFSHKFHNHVNNRGDELDDQNHNDHDMYDNYEKFSHKFHNHVSNRGNELDHQNHNDHDIYDDYEKFSHKLYNHVSIRDNPTKEEEGDDDDDVGGVSVMQGYYYYRPLGMKKGEEVVIVRRPRGLEGFWQRQAYLRSYKFTRRRSLWERTKASMQKLRMAWGIARGLYGKQVKGVRMKVKAICNYANFHRTSFLLLSKQYMHPCSTLSFKSSRFVHKSFNPHSC